MKKILIIIIFLIVSTFLYSQTIYKIDTYNGQSVITCNGLLYDSGGDTINYSNNETYTISFGSNNQLNNSCKVFFQKFDIHPTDTLYIYDGATTNSQLIGAFNNSNTLYLNYIQASVYNYSGKLTFKFVSDSSIIGSGFKAQISCSLPCQNFISLIDTINTHPYPNNNLISTCENSISFVGKGNYINNGYNYYQVDDSSSFYWDFGDSTIGNGKYIEHLYSDTGIFNVNLTITDQIGCHSLITNVVNVKNMPKAMVNISSDMLICQGSSTNIIATGGDKFLWNTGDTTETISVTPPFNTTYSVIATNQYGCNDTATVQVSVLNNTLNENICIVTIGTNTFKNKILWNKEPNLSIKSYNIYKEQGTNNYVLIGNVPYDSLSLFIDYNSVPESHADKYKISAIDTCNNESVKSYYHKTINLIISGFGSTMGLNWSFYEDESGAFTPQWYYIYRGTQPYNMQIIDSISGSFNSYNDLNINDVYYYIIGIKKTDACDISKYNESMSFSNKTDNSNLINNITLNNNNNEIKVYPNPSNGIISITYTNDCSIKIIDLTGKIVLQQLNNDRLIDISSLSAGTYIIELKDKNRVVRARVIKNL